MLKTPTIECNREAVEDFMIPLCSKEPEQGGIILGPIGADHIITEFYYDKGGSCTGSTYSPDHKTLSKKMQEQWLPITDMKGFCHSHPGGFDRLSRGDLVYIQRLLKINPEMSMFIAPIIIPEQFRFIPYVVLRENPSQPVIAEVAYF